MSTVAALFHCSLVRAPGHALHLGMMAGVPLAFAIPFARMRSGAVARDDDDARRARYLSAFGVARREGARARSRES